MSSFLRPIVGTVVATPKRIFKRQVRMRGSVCIANARSMAKTTNEDNDNGKGNGKAESVPSARFLMHAIREHLEYNKRRLADKEERHKLKELVEYRRIMAEEPDINVQSEGCSPWLLICSVSPPHWPFWHNEDTGEARMIREGDPRF